MPLLDYVDLIPEDKREAFRAEATAAIFVTSREDAAKLIRSNAFVQSEVDAERSRVAASVEKRITEEKLPQLLDEKLKEAEAKGKKQPWEVEIEKLRAENESIRKENARKERLSKVMADITTKGLPADPEILSLFVGDDDESTTQRVEKYSTIIGGWKDAEVKKVLEGKFSQSTPKAGGGDTPTNLEAQYQAAQKANNVAAMIHIKGQLAQQLATQQLTQ